MDVGTDGCVDGDVLTDRGKGFSAAREEDNVCGGDEREGCVCCGDEVAVYVWGEEGCQLFCS